MANEKPVCRAIQDMREEERRIGKLEKAQEAARNLYNLGVDLETVARGVGYAVEIVRQWIEI